MTIVVNMLSCIFEAIIILMFLDAYVDKSKEVNDNRYYFFVIALSAVIVLSNAILNLGLLNFVVITLSTFIIAFIYSKNIKRNIILSIIPVLILGIAEIIVVFFITLTSGVTVKQVVTVENYILLGTILSKLFAFFMLKFICVIYKKNRTPAMKTSYWMLFLVMFVTSVITIFLIFELQYENKSVLMHNLSVWSSFGLLYSTFFALCLYEKLSEQAEIEKRQELFAQQIRAQSKHIDEILITQRELRKLRHDLANHNISIKAYFERQDYKAGLEYMQDMDGLARVSEKVIETGNVALDAIMNTKKSIAESKEIEFEANIQIPENIFVDAIDICIIFGNALDNCIEACEQIENGKKKITVSIVYEDNSIICKIVNSAAKSNNKFLHTAKKDAENHGFGISNIESAMEKYKNVCRFKQTEDEFILSFVIFKD